MPLPCILGGFKSHQKQFFEIFEGKNCEKIENYRKKSKIFGKNRTNEISVHFSFRGSPKNDISAKYRPKKPKFLSMVITTAYMIRIHRGSILISEHSKSIANLGVQVEMNKSNTTNTK